MISIGFYNHVNTKPRATEASLKSIRKFYPDAPIAISCDNAYDFTDMCKTYNAFYEHNNVTLGYPVQPFGYRKPQILEWSDRMYRGVRTLGTDYFVMMEDDVHVIAPIEIDPIWEMAGHVYSDGQVYLIPDALLDIIEQFSGIRPITNYYNCGGGSIFKTNTFLTNYHKVRKFFDEYLDDIQNKIYPTSGWMDCYMCLFYYLCGKPLVQNTRLYNNWPIKIPFVYSDVPKGTYLIHNFKDYYE